MDVTWFYEDLFMRRGIWGEFVLNLASYYRDVLSKSCNTSQYRDQSLSVNPVVVDRVLTHMLDEAGVRVLRNVDLISVEAVARAVVVETSAGTCSGRVTVDASEDGRLIHLSGIPRRIANTVLRSSTSPPDLAGRLIQDITQTAMIRDYSETGLPPQLALPLAPPGYDARRRIIASRYPHGPSKSRLGEDRGFAGYRGAPDLATNRDYSGSAWREITRTSLNFANDVRTEAPFLTDAAARAATEQKAIHSTYAVLYFLQQECGLPWGLVTDEGFGEGPSDRIPEHRLALHPEMSVHLPPIPYIRESVRILGQSTMTGKSTFRIRQRSIAKWDHQVVAIGTYPPDLHGGRRPEDMEEDLLESLDDKPPRWQEGPFPVPLGALVPDKKVAIIAAEKNISASRIAASAVRLQPTVTAVGQAAGVLAALCAERRALPQDIPPLDVQLELALAGAALAPAPVEGLPDDPHDRAAAELAIARGAVDYTTTAVRRLESDPGVLQAPTISTDVLRAVHVGRAMIAPRPNS